MEKKNLTVDQWARKCNDVGRDLVKNPERLDHFERDMNRLLYVLSWSDFGDLDMDQATLNAVDHQFGTHYPLSKN